MIKPTALLVSICLVNQPMSLIAAERVIDNANLRENKKQEQSQKKTLEVEEQQSNIHRSITCSVARGSRSNSPTTAANENPEVVALARKVAKEEGIREDLFLGLVYQESRFNACARSPVGAFGLTQLMPDTARELGVNQYNVEQNLRGGARYLATQLKRYNGNENLALAAYNAGAGNVNKYHGIPPFKETNTYVYNITQKWKPAFAGIENTTLPAYSNLENTTLNAMAINRATNDNLADAAGWYKNFQQVQSNTVLDAWDYNSRVRNGNAELVNRVIELGGTLGDLLNARNTIGVQETSQSNKFFSGTYERETEQPKTREECINRNMGWDEQRQRCLSVIQPQPKLDLEPK